MMENMNKKLIQDIHCVEGKHSDKKVSTYVKECESSVDGIGKRKVSHIVDGEYDTDDGNWSGRNLSNVKRQHMSESDDKNIDKTSAVVYDLQVQSSSSSSLSSAAAASSFTCSLDTDSSAYCENKNKSLPLINLNMYQVCYESLDMSNTKHNSILPVNGVDSLSRISCTTDFREEAKRNLSNNCKQVRFSHDVNIIPDIFPPCPSICHTSVNRYYENDMNKNKNENDCSSEMYDDGCCSSSIWDKLPDNLSSSLNQICVCQHSECRVVHNCRQIFEHVPPTCEWETESYITRNGNFPGISHPSADGAQATECSICFVTFTDQKVASPGTCSHKFCFDCLQQWAVNMNTCPLDRLRFNMIFVKERTDGKIIDHIPVKNCELEDDDMDNDVDYCEICRRRSVGRDEILISCYRCGRMYHLTCLSSPVDILTFENWVCPDCGVC